VRRDSLTPAERSQIGADRVGIAALDLQPPGAGKAARRVDGVLRVEADDPAVLDVHRGDAVAGGGHDEAVVEADVGAVVADALEIGIQVERRRRGPLQRWIMHAGSCVAARW